MWAKLVIINAGGRQQAAYNLMISFFFGEFFTFLNQSLMTVACKAHLRETALWCWAIQTKVT